MKGFIFTPEGFTAVEGDSPQPPEGFRIVLNGFHMRDGLHGYVAVPESAPSNILDLFQQFQSTPEELGSSSSWVWLLA